MIDQALSTPAPVSAESRAKGRAKLRLALFAVAIVALALAVGFGGVLNIDREQLQADIRGFGPLAPIVFVLLSGGLSALFVPGPVFAVLAGVLFGPVAGIPLSVCGAALAALIGREAGAHLGRSAAEELVGQRMLRLAGWLERYGLRAVIGLRLMPATPDALLSYATGLTRLPRLQIALGTAIGSTPRTLGWGLVGATIAGGSAWLGTAGGVLIVGTDVCGAVAVVLVARRLGIGPRTLWSHLRDQPA